MGCNWVDRSRKEICEVVLKWATPSCSPRGPRTPTASPGSAVPRSTTSLEKTHGWPEARRSTAFRLIRTVLNPPSSPTGEVRRSERLRRTRATPRLARCHSRQTGWKVPRYAQEQGFEMSAIATHAHQCQPAPPLSHGNPPRRSSLGRESLSTGALASSRD